MSNLSRIILISLGFAIGVAMEINLQFRNPEQEKFYWSQSRNNEFDGAFANGKSYAGCMRAFTHLTTFGNYSMSIARQEYKTLRQTTMKTFFKICPDSLIYRHDEQQGLTVLINKSFIYWMHLDDYDEQDLRGLEINSALIDQAEEIQENIYNVLDARIGRWDKAQVPIWLLRSLLSGEDFELSKRIERDNPNDLNKFIEKFTQWPRHKKWGHFLVPNYMDVLCNVADDEEFHWTYRFYNPDSPERRPDHSYVHREMDQSLNDERTYQQMLLRDQEFVDKYVLGKRGGNRAQIHKVDKLSIIDPADYPEEDFKKFIETLRSKAALYRILDHGETGVTCCLWGAAINGIHILYREYYVNRTLVSDNRRNIHEMSLDHIDSEGIPIYEDYSGDFADPQIFKVTQQSISGIKSGFTTVAAEYLDTDDISDPNCPPIAWAPADNNEFATRNRINELLGYRNDANEFIITNSKFMHPITRIAPAPGIYFIKKHPRLYPYGCEQAIIQTKNQRKTLLGSDNGKNIYSEDRDEAIVDHAYDCVRYYVSMHNTGKPELKKPKSRNTFAFYNAVLKNRPRFVPTSY